MYESFMGFILVKILVVLISFSSHQISEAFFSHLRESHHIHRALHVAQVSSAVAERVVQSTNSNAQHPFIPERTRPFPMDFVVGQRLAKEAIILAAINPNINGLVIWGRRGTGKSVLARSILSLLPPTISIVKGSAYNIDPDTDNAGGIDTLLLTEMVRGERPSSLQDMERQEIPCPFVDIPLNVMEDSLVGTADLEKSLETGKTIFSPGLLARAHRGVLYVDDINLLDEEAANLLLNVLNEGWVRVEREGLSVQYPCKPCIFVATYNPEEGEFREHLQDRIGLSLTVDATRLSVLERVNGVENGLGFAPGSRKQESESATDALHKAEEHERQMQEIIANSRNRLQSVKLTSKQIHYLCEEATRANCEGQRGEIYAAEIAKASAALHGRDFVDAEDLQKAVLLAIAPRARLELEEEEQQENMMSNDSIEEPASPPPDQQGSCEPSQEEKNNGDDEKEEDTDEEEELLESEQVEQDEKGPEQSEESKETEEIIEVPQEFMFGVKTTTINPKLLAFARWAKKGRAGKGSRVFNLNRGRFIKAVFPKGKEGKIAVGATLRASAPYQKLRRAKAIGTKNEKRVVFIKSDDFRIKKMAKKASTLVIFCVDASGSMALNRMNAAKGAAISLLAEAYKHRDKICLISFRDTAAEVLVPPTKSTALTKNRLEYMPCGGGSPLSHGLMTAMKMGVNEKKFKKDVGQVVIVIITDGRANIPLSLSLGQGFDPTFDPLSKDGIPSRNFLKNEVMEIAKRLAALPNFNFLVIDTEDKFVGTGLGAELARVGKGNYHHLEEADTNAVEKITKRNLEAIR